MSAPVKPRLTKEDREWRARNAIDTLQRAEQLKRDSAVMRDVKRLARQQQAALAKIARHPVPKTRKPR